MFRNILIISNSYKINSIKKIYWYTIGKYEREKVKLKVQKKERRMKNYSKRLYSDFGLFVCGQCGRFLKADDLPCACGNEDELKEFFYTPTGFEQLPDFKGRHDVNRETDVYIT
jgi:hypothetical protein